MIYAVYDTASGEISRFVTCGPDSIAIQCQEGEKFYPDCPATATHITVNGPVTLPPTLTIPQQIAVVQDAVQLHLDNVARERNYDNILSLASYAVSTDPIFSAEGAAGAAWRDACWRLCYEQLGEVMAGTRPMPTPEEAILALPLMEWP